MANQNPGIRIPPVGDCTNSVRQAIQDIVRRLGSSSQPTYETIKLLGLTVSRLTATDSSGNLASTNVSDWLSGTNNQISVTNDNDGTATLSTPQDIHTGASPAFTAVKLDGDNIKLSYNGDDMVLTDVAAGAKTLSQLSSGGGENHVCLIADAGDVSIP